MRTPIALCVLLVACSMAGPARAQTVKSAVYIDLESYVSNPPTRSGVNCAGNCSNVAKKVCTGIGYKFGMPVRFIDGQVAGVACFDTTAPSISFKAPSPANRKE
jgi:hypothetical protein